MISPDANNRILIVDDNPSIHDDFRKILTPEIEVDVSMDALLHNVLGNTEQGAAHTQFEVDSAYQGREGLEKVLAALAENRPYSLAFVDVRMPPGWDGIETITRIWEKAPDIQIIICTAYSDYSWQDIISKLRKLDQLVILKKPFDNIEVLQLAHAMTTKWRLTQQAAMKVDELDRRVRERTAELEASNTKLLAEISERERAQAALRLSEELASTFDACPLPTAILQVADQRIVHANPALALATERPNIVGQTLWDLGLEMPDDFRNTSIIRMAKGEAMRRHECDFITKSGERRRGMLWLEPITLASGPHLLALLQDITEQTRLENELRQAHKMEAVGHLAAGVAHDFNNLLTVIHGNISLELHEANLAPGLTESLCAVQDAAARAAELTRQLLAFSRKQIMEMAQLCLSKVVNNFTGMLTRLIPENIAVHYLHEESGDTFLGDRCNIEQVLLNLIVNARDAMPNGGLIFVSTAVVDIDATYVRQKSEARVGRFVCLQVRDTGTGISSETLRRIFEPFFTTKETGKGTGMGLATVHGIVKQHNGWIDVSSTPGNGTTFRVHLPQAAPDVPKLSSPSPTLKIDLSGRTILLAEDDASLRGLARRVFAASGLRLLEARDGHAALALWKEHRKEIDLLLTDMIMPGSLSGSELADQVLGDRPELPVIYCSGYSEDLFNDNREFNRGVNYLPKPYLPVELLRIVSAALVKN